MPNYRVDRRDLEFVLFDQLNLEGLTKLPAYKDMGRAELQGVLEAGETMAVELLAPTSAVADREGCRLVDGQVKVPQIYERAYKEYAEGGWVAMTRPPALGGMGLPVALAAAVVEMHIGAASSFAFYPGLTVAAGHLLEVYGKPELRDLMVPKLYKGEWAGTMCLTEPQAGTAVGDLRTSARPLGGDRYAIKGNKIFISAGDHQLTKNILHLVLARVEGDPAGTKGISLFAVPKLRFDAQGNLGQKNDVTVTGIEHKLGINGSATCALSFGDNDACEGILIGERCNGIVYMFQMMNEARMVCGIQGVAMGNAAYQLALEYAKGRVQGAKVTDRSKDQRPVAIIEHPDVRRNLMLCKAWGEGIRALVLSTASHADYAQHHTDAGERQKHHDLLDLMTPICKAYATDVGFRMCEIALQVHGGYGYIREYGVEQHLRDIKIASIYEGANGIQALDLLGRKLRLKDGALFMTWLQEANESLAACSAYEPVAAEAQAVDKAKNQLAEVALNFAAQSAQDPEVALLGATPFLEMFGHVETARLLVQQAMIAHKKIGAEKPTGEALRYLDAKVKTARFFVAQILPHATALAKSIKAGDRSALDIQL